MCNHRGDEVRRDSILKIRGRDTGGHACDEPGLRAMVQGLERAGVHVVLPATCLIRGSYALDADQGRDVPSLSEFLRHGRIQKASIGEELEIGLRVLPHKLRQPEEEQGFTTE